MYLGCQPQICCPCGSGGVSSISITHVETFHSLIRAKSWNRLWQTMKAGKTELRHYRQNQMINFEGRLYVSYGFFINLALFLQDVSFYLESYPYFFKCIFEKQNGYRHTFKLH